MSQDDPKNPLFFQDFLIETQHAQCEWCGEIGPDIDLVRVIGDAGAPMQVCPSCKEEAQG